MRVGPAESPGERPTTGDSAVEKILGLRNTETYVESVEWLLEGHLGEMHRWAMEVGLLDIETRKTAVKWAALEVIRRVQGAPDARKGKKPLKPFEVRSAAAFFAYLKRRVQGRARDLLSESERERLRIPTPTRNRKKKGENPDGGDKEKEYTAIPTAGPDPDVEALADRRDAGTESPLADPFVRRAFRRGLTAREYDAWIRVRVNGEVTQRAYAAKHRISATVVCRGLKRAERLLGRIVRDEKGAKG